MLTNFDYIRLDDYFGEDYLQLHYHGDINLKDEKLDYLITYNQRDNLYSEFFFDRSETASLKNLNLSLYAKNRKTGNSSNPLIYNAGINFSHKNINKNDSNFSRNVIDQDGESLEPFYSEGKFNDLIFSANGKKKLTENLDFIFDNYNGLVQFSPNNVIFTNKIYYENNITPFHSLYITEWNSEAFSTGIVENTFGLNYFKKSASNRASINLKGNLTYDGIYFSPYSISSLNFEIGLNLSKKIGRRFSSTLDLGKRRVAFEYDQVKFLSNKYQSGESYYWNDNGDQQYSNAEKGMLFKTTGGKYHKKSPELKQPEIYYLDYTTKWDMGKNWGLIFLAQYRKFANQWIVGYKETTDDLGSFQTNSEGQDIFYLEGGKTTNYNVVPFNKELFAQLAEKKLGWLFDSPFYGGLTLNLEKKTPNTYIYIS
ncbi:MAG: hypothetical protein NWS46_07385, partial [Cyclobacteriaceae bacterium]|nr:hypothetical protein [Cyclobacteriaceae bacterium]